MGAALDLTRLTIGGLATRAGVNVETIRYYERRALLPAPPRGASGYRQYAPDTVRRVRFIKRAQALGFTLDEIRDLLALRAEPAESCETVEAQADLTIRRIDAKVAELERMRRALARLADDCRHRRSADDCPILIALEEEAVSERSGGA
jgi:MerR family mercuric resistance operon transcriptional regulator